MLATLGRGPAPVGASLLAKRLARSTTISPQSERSSRRSRKSSTICILARNFFSAPVNSDSYLTPQNPVYFYPAQSGGMWLGDGRQRLVYFRVNQSWTSMARWQSKGSCDEYFQDDIYWIYAYSRLRRY